MWGKALPKDATGLADYNSVQGRFHFDPLEFTKLNDLHAALQSKVKQISLAIKRQVASGEAEVPNEEVRSLVREGRRLQAAAHWEVRALTRRFGLTQAERRAIESAYDTARLPKDCDLWHKDIIRDRESEDLDALSKAGLENLMSLVDSDWLRTQAKQEYRLDTTFLHEPLHLVNGLRIGMNLPGAGPHRFARMLLVCQDHFSKRWDLDFFSCAMFAPEVAGLGNSLREIDELGPEAVRKLADLPSMPDDVVASTIFELLVGAACVRRGLDTTMVAENRSTKVPDLTVAGLGPIPVAIECKRRLGLTAYELAEAKQVEKLYGMIRPVLVDAGVHATLEASFRVPIRELAPEEFARDAVGRLRSDNEEDPIETPWGSLAFKRLPYCGEIRRTRLYSPEYLQKVFGWEPADWDGLLCEVEPPLRVDVSSYKLPICLKWKSESAEARQKKERGVMSLWGAAVKQIPDGENGAVYIAYPEGARPTIADARTRDLLKSMGDSWHRWSVRIPVTIISRLYARTFGAGMADLFENVVVGASKGQEGWLTELPWRVFTGQF